MSFVSSCGFPRRYGDCDELIRFVEQARQFLRSSNVDFQLSKYNNVAEHFEPEAGFVRLLLDCAQLRDEIGFRFSNVEVKHLGFGIRTSAFDIPKVLLRGPLGGEFFPLIKAADETLGKAKTMRPRAET